MLSTNTLALWKIFEFTLIVFKPQVVEVMASHTTTELRTLFHRSHDEIRHRGYTSTPPRSLQCASAVNDMLGLAVAYAIADPHFYNVTKPQVHMSKETNDDDEMLTHPFLISYYFYQVTVLNLTIVKHFLSDRRHAMGNEKSSCTTCQQSEMDG